MLGLECNSQLGSTAASLADIALATHLLDPLLQRLNRSAAGVQQLSTVQSQGHMATLQACLFRRTMHIRTSMHVHSPHTRQKVCARAVSCGSAFMT